MQDLANVLTPFIAWLEKQPRFRTYRYMTSEHCLIAQYLTSLGFRDVRVGREMVEFYIFRKDEPNIYHFLDLPIEMDMIARGSPFHLFRTFGGALKRAKRALQEKYALQATSSWENIVSQQNTVDIRTTGIPQAA